MTDFLISVLMLFMGIFFGICVEYDHTYTKCVKANQHIPVGQIKEFCNERLYRN